MLLDDSCLMFQTKTVFVYVSPALHLQGVTGGLFLESKPGLFFLLADVVIPL